MPTPPPRFRPRPLPLPGFGSPECAGGSRADAPHPRPPVIAPKAGEPDRRRSGAIEAHQDGLGYGEAAGEATSGRRASRGGAPRPEVPAGAILQRWADDLARAWFGLPFSGSVVWAPRLHYRAGDFTPTTGRIRLSLPYFVRYGAEEARRILLHELCHWWLYQRGLAHRENAPAFQKLLATVGAPARARPLPRPRRPRSHVYGCPHCGQRYRYTRRVDYACGRCCRAFARGRYDPRFRLRLLSAPPRAGGHRPPEARRPGVAGRA